MALILVVRERVEWFGWKDAQSAVVAGCIAEGLLGLGWFVTRVLKKRGALEA
jgi:hypothetical protein